MAWSANKNQVFFQRAQNWAAAAINLLEERNRLIDIYNNEANGDPAFIDTDIATVAELIALAINVMTPFNNMINNISVTTAARIQYLTPFLINQE